MITGKQTWIFDNKPVIKSAAAVGGPFEAKGNIVSDFDFIYDDIHAGQKSFEKAEQKMLEDACNKALYKANLQKDDIQFFICGDLINQIMPSNLTARSLGIPYLGIYGACSNSMMGLSIASLLVETGFASNVLAACSSHNAAAEKQYRYPTEYGVQKPPSSQWTVTGAGASIVSNSGYGPKIIAATIGKVIDFGTTDPYNMGAAMAPAAVDTIITHLNELNLPPEHYDIIATGDLGKTGHEIAKDLLKEQKIYLPDCLFLDCGMLIYKENQKVFSGGSGCACSAVVTYGHFYNKMLRGELKRILVIATGALLSPLSFQQKETIPCIAHAVSIEMQQ